MLDRHSPNDLLVSHRYFQSVAPPVKQTKMVETLIGPFETLLFLPIIPNIVSSVFGFGAQIPYFSPICPQQRSSSTRHCLGSVPSLSFFISSSL